MSRLAECGREFASHFPFLPHLSGCLPARRARRLAFPGYLAFLLSLSVARRLPLYIVLTLMYCGTFSVFLPAAGFLSRLPKALWGSDYYISEQMLSQLV